jgi:hypothetical protein
LQPPQSIICCSDKFGGDLVGEEMAVMASMAAMAANAQQEAENKTNK